MELVRSSSTEFPSSAGERITNEYIGVDVRDNDNALVKEFDSLDKHDLDSAKSKSKYEVDDNESKDRCQSRDKYDQQEEIEGLEKKMMILADASKLKLLAKYFLHPNEKIVSNGLMGRCFFDRASAPEVISKEESYVRAMILADAKALKANAVRYFNPNMRIDEVKPTTFGRSFLTDDDEPKERAQILSDVDMLKNYTSAYLHPEVKGVNDYLNTVSSLKSMSKRG